MEEHIEELTVFEKLDKIRFGTGSDYEITMFLKELSCSYDIEIFESLIKDIDTYLFIERDEKESEFTNIDIDLAIKERLKNGLDVPYHKTREPHELTESQKKIRERLRKRGFAHDYVTPRVDVEKLLFPFEFYNIYNLQVRLKNKIGVIKPRNIGFDKKLSIPQIALKLVYENRSVTKENADTIIKDYGWNSGHRLKQDFDFYNQRANRTADPDVSKRILINKIKLFESIIELIADEFKQKAMDECNILNNYLLKY